MELEKIFYKTIDEFNDSQTEYEIKKDNLFDYWQWSALDSMAIINFFTRLEKNLFKTLKKEIDLINNIFSLNKDKITLGELISFLEDSVKK